MTDFVVFTYFRDFFFVLALSMHAVFEGLAVGLEGDEEGVWILFTAVCTHKFVMAFCMGVELVRKSVVETTKSTFRISNL